MSVPSSMAQEKSQTLRKKKNRSLFFNNNLNRTISRFTLSAKTKSAQQITEGDTDYEVEAVPTPRRMLRRNPRKRSKLKKSSLKEKSEKLDVQYDGDKVIDEENVNIEERIRNILKAKAVRRKEIYDASALDEDAQSIRSRHSAHTLRTDADQDSLAPRSGLMRTASKSAALNLLSLSIRRRKASAKSFGQEGKRKSNVDAHSKVRQAKLPTYPKCIGDRIIIKKALEKNIFFSEFGEDEVDLFTNVLQERIIKKGVALYDASEEKDSEHSNDEFFIVKEGKVIIKNGNKSSESDKNVVLAGESYGEINLIHSSQKSSERIITAEDTSIFVIDKKTYTKVVAYSEEDRLSAIRKVLYDVPLLQTLSKSQIRQLAECVQIVKFKAGDPIIVKGDVGEVFYIIKKGSVRCTKVGTEEQNLLDITLKVCDYFGERALVVNEPRAANVVALEDTECLALNKDSFNSHLGSLASIMNKNQTLRILKSVPLFNDIPNKKLLKILASMHEEEYLPGHQIIEQGAKNRKLFVIIEGEVEIQVFDTSDRQKHTTVETLKKGQFFGEGSSLKSAPVSQAEYVALTKVVCHTILTRKHMRLMKSIAQTLKRHNSTRQKTVIAKVRQQSFSVDNKAIKLEDLNHIKTLGTGTFGRVKLVEHRPTGDVYALKILQKSFIVKYKQQKNVMNEKMVMIKSQHPFILKLEKTFVTKNCLYFLLELVQGGELFSLLQQSGGYLKPHYAKFYAACVVDAIGYLHKRKIVYRDLKPENLLIDAQGYIRVVDFGFAKKVEKKTFTLCGTPEYLAPETVKHLGHNRAVDYWAIGVLVYEMICGFSPFSDMDEDSQDQVFGRILKGNFAFPRNFPRHARLLVRKLMAQNPQERIGMFKDGPDEIKTQYWFKEIDFEKLLKKELPVPWLPKITKATDTRHFEFFEEDDKETPYKGSNKYWSNF